MQHFVGVIIIFLKLTKTTRLLPDFTKAWKTMACPWGCRRAARWPPLWWLPLVMRPTTSTSSSWSPGGAELAGIPPCAAEEGETELARTTPVFYFIKTVPWRTKSWRLATMAPQCRGR